MKTLIAGAAGQLGRELVRTAPPGMRLVALDRAGLDIADAASVRAALRRERPDVIINAAAYNAVDQAESEPALAFAINRDGPARLAAASAERGARFIHVSTDFVFAGRARRPYRPASPCHPLGVYGASKRAGEIAVLEACPGALVARTAWVFSPFARNFLKAILQRLAAAGEASVVVDQVGSPTAAGDLAEALWRLATTPARGLHHLVNSGQASRFDFAQAIAEEAIRRGLAPPGSRILPVAAASLPPTPARRPAYSVLDASRTTKRLGAPLRPWREALVDTLERMRAGEG